MDADHPVHHLLAAFFTDTFFNRLYLLASRYRDGQSVTDHYVNVCTSYVAGLKDPKNYRTVAGDLHNYYMMHMCGGVRVTFGQFEVAVTDPFVPGDVRPSMQPAHRDKLMHTVLVGLDGSPGVVKQMHDYICSPEMLQLVISERDRKHHAIIAHLQEHCARVLVVIQAAMLRRFTGGALSEGLGVSNAELLGRLTETQQQLARYAAVMKGMKATIDKQQAVLRALAARQRGAAPAPVVAMAAPAPAPVAAAPTTVVHHQPVVVQQPVPVAQAAGTAAPVAAPPRPQGPPPPRATVQPAADDSSSSSESEDEAARAAELDTDPFNNMRPLAESDSDGEYDDDEY